MISSLVFLLLYGNIALSLGNAQKLPKAPGKKASLKVYINTTSDSILMKFLRPNPNTKLEGFVLGYGSNSHSNQYFPLPSEGKSSEAEVDAEPKYLIVVRPVPPPSQKKKCSGKSRSRKPLQMVVGTLTPSSVFLSWGFLINPQYDWTLPSQCPNDRLYTVRYREKDKEKKWIFQICPATETVVENLKPNTIYEFGVKDNLEGGLWSKIFNHKTVVGTKNKGNGKIQSTYDQIHTVPAFIPKKIIPITVIKQVIQNVTHRAASKSPDRPSVGGTILVHLIIPGLNDTTLKGPPPVMLDISETVKTPLAKNETLTLPAESKKPEEEKMPTLPAPVTMETVQRTMSPTVTSVLEISEATLASDEIQWIAPTVKTSGGLKVLQSHTAAYDMQPVSSNPPTTDEPEISTAQTAPPKSKWPSWQRTKTTPAPKAPPTKPASKLSRPKTKRPKTKTTPSTSTTQTISAYEPVTRRTETSMTTLAPQLDKSPPYAGPQLKATLSPDVPEIKPVVESATFKTETMVTTIAPGLRTVITHSPTTLAQIKTKPTHPKRHRHKTTEKPEKSQTKSALEPATFRPVTPGATLAPKVSATRRPRPRPQPGSHPRPRPRPRPRPHSNLPQTTTPRPEAPQTKPVPTAALEPATFRPVTPGATLAPIDVQTNLSQTTSPRLEKPPITPAHKLIIQNRTKSPSHPKLKTTPSPPVPQTKPAPAEIHYAHPIPKTSQSPAEQQTKAAPKQTTRAPPKTKTTPSSVKPAPKGSRDVTSKPKISPRPHVSPTVPAPTERPISSSPQPSLSPIISPITYVPEENTIRIKQPKTTIVPTTITLRTATSTTIAHRDVHKPGPDVSQIKPAPTGTKGIPLKPKTSPSPSQDVLQTTWAETSRSTQQPVTTKDPRTYKRMKTTQVPNKIYTTTTKRQPVKPDKNRTISGTVKPKPNGISQETGYTKSISEDLKKPFNAPKNISLDATKKPGTAPDSHHPTLPPPKPTQTKRKPLPPNNVTGKPGSTGTILLPRVTSPPPKVKPTGPTVPKKTETDKKQPTVSVSEEYGNLTDFSSSPTRETDSLGNQRFVAPHVKYIPKPENEPCSITDSMKWFPKEEVSEENPTSPPQNPPTNVTVVTVEGCSSFVILDWDKPQNDTVTEYEIRSKENGAPTGKKESIQTTNQTFSTIENLKPNTSYEFQVTPRNPLGEGPPSKTVAFSTESADPRVSEPISAGRDAIWTEIPFKSDSYSECKGKQYVKRTWYKKFVGVQLCNSLRYKIYLSDSLTGKFYNIGDQRGHGEDHCQFVDSFLDGRTGQQLNSDQLPIKEGYFRAVRQEPVQFGEIGGHTQINYVHWYECGTTIPGKW